MAKRKRNVPLLFWVSEQEKEMIDAKMEQLGTGNLSAYLRKMAIDGYVVKLDLPELKELVSLLRYSSNNLNQLTKRCMRRAVSTRPIWTTCGRAMTGCGKLLTRSFLHWRPFSDRRGRRAYAAPAFLLGRILAGNPQIVYS